MKQSTQDDKRESEMHFLITAGGTREYIDPVRFISNASSGRMGFALARAAIRDGQKVTLITAATAQRIPAGARVVEAKTSGEMFEAVRKYFGRCDCLIMAAAVSDYTPIRVAGTKIKKGADCLTIKLKPTRDILEWAGKHKRVESRKEKGKKRRRQIVVGFALEDGVVRRRAGEKLREKNLDMIIANTPAAIGSEKATVQIKIPGQKWVTLTRATKAAIAKRVISLVGREMLLRRRCE